MRPRLAQAFSLIENMVALAILSVGLLGIAGMFSEALRQLQSNAMERSAVMLGDELVSHLILARAQIDHRDIECSLALGNCFDQADLQSSMNAWFARLHQTLPGALAELTMHARTATQRFSIQISWTDRTGQARSHRIAFLLRR